MAFRLQHNLSWAGPLIFGPCHLQVATAFAPRSVAALVKFLARKRGDVHH